VVAFIVFLGWFLVVSEAEGSFLTGFQAYRKKFTLSKCCCAWVPIFSLGSKFRLLKNCPQKVRIIFVSFVNIRVPVILDSISFREGIFLLI
jgi:hypothetical protein